MLRPIFVSAALAVAVAFGLGFFDPVMPLPASAPPGEFSAERAMRVLDVVAAKPHPTGTAADDEVREYLVRELEALGFALQVQDATALTDAAAKRWGAPVIAGHVRNVVARRAGREPGPALALTAHYDSRELAPGASDDGFGVAALLETARALTASPPLRHDVMLVLTEGEEQGLLGAKAFLEESPAARDVGLVLNFEARGDRGPVLAFQTSERAGALIDALARSPHVAATSLSQEVYRRMPNNTDLTLWIRAGYAAMNFANVDGVARYHQTTDTVANADPATLQHDGSYALTLARAFADAPVLPPPEAEDEVYFTVAPLFVHYPARGAVPLAIVATALFGAALLVGWRRARVRIGGAAAGAGLALVAVAMAALAGAAVWWVADRVSGGALGMSTARGVLRDATIATLVLLGGGVTWAIFAASRRWIRNADLAIGALLPWAVLALGTAFALRGASYLFVWPLLAAGVGWCARVAARPLADAHPVAIALHLVASMAAFALVAPVALQIGAAFGPASAALLAGLGAIAAIAAVPAMGTFGDERRWVAPGLLVGACVTGIGVASLLPSFDAASPRPDSLLYVLDADRAAASWVSFDAATDAWTVRPLAGAVRDTRVPIPRLADPVLHAPAPFVALDPPRVAVLADARAGATRALHLRVTLPVGTEAVELVAPPQARVIAARVQGKSFGPIPEDGRFDLAFFGPPTSGLDLELETTGSGALNLQVLAQTRGIPRDAAALLGPRGPDRMPAVAGGDALKASDMTLVSASVGL